MRDLKIVDRDGDTMCVECSSMSVSVLNCHGDALEGRCVILNKDDARLLRDYLQEFLGEAVPANLKVRFASFEDLDSDEDEMVQNGRVVVLADSANPDDVVEDELIYGIVTDDGVIDLSDGEALWGLDDYYVVRSSTLAEAAAVLAKRRDD